jgi:N-acetylglucosamine-6-phosphate deacetylase
VIDRAALRVAGGRVLTPSGWIDGDVVVAGRRVARIDRSPARRTAGPTVDARGLLVAPGLIDLQVNGGFGRDFTSDPLTIWYVGARLPRYGVTAFLPTIVSAPAGTVESALRVLAAGPPPGYAGAAPLGLHCEGPMLAPSRRGAHEARHLRLPSKKLIEGWSRASGVRLVTLAPELRGSSSVIATLAAHGVVVSAGHSNATYEQARRAFDSGVFAGTHLFNAMSGFGHREPGLAGALLAGEPIVGLIADGVHVHPAAVDLAWQLKGPRRVVLVTDAAASMGARPGPERRLGEAAIRVRGGAPRTPDGALAGSLLTLDAAVRNVVAFTGCDTADALSAASATPAALIGEARRGRTRAGFAADLVVLDTRLRVVATVVAGHLAFDRRRRAP